MEYPALTKQQPGFYTGPTELLEPNGHDKGGLAEYAVYNILKDYSESLGLSMVFLSDKSRFKAFNLEVKGSNAQVKKLSTTRRHACSQLQNHRDILGFEFQLPKSVLDKIREHVVWPNLQSTEYCKSCKMEHTKFIRKPETCKEKGSNFR